MHRPRKDSPILLTPMAVCRKGYVVFGCLVILCLFVSPILAEDFGLANPAEKDFAEFKSDTKTMGGFAKKNSTFNDRSLPISKKSETIRQVSASENDPFPVVTQPMEAQPLAMQSPSTFDWGSTASAIPNNPLLAQNNVILYDPGVAAGGYVNPYAVAQYMYPAGADATYPQFAQYPQQYPQEYANPYMNQYTMGVYSPYGYTADPYGMSGSPMDYQTGYQNVPDYSSVYQTLLLQEMARQQAEENQPRANNDRQQDGDEAKKQADAQWTLNNLVPVRVSSPLGETLVACAKTVNPFSTPMGPDKGVGMPLVNKSWLDHPWYFGGFVGAISGSELVSQMIKQKTGGNGGLICGYNFNEYWGVESRLHFASIDIYDTDLARQVFEANFKMQFPEAEVVPPLSTRTNELTVLDATVHYYPLGNAKWRPYFKYGLGFGQQKFTNTFGYEQSADIVTMPLGLGMRYWWNERIAIQADLIDNVVFSSKIAKTQNNIALTVGLTYSFGSGKKKYPIHYWPATPSMGSKW